MPTPLDHLRSTLVPPFESGEKVAFSAFVVTARKCESDSNAAMESAASRGEAGAPLCESKALWLAHELSQLGNVLREPGPRHMQVDIADARADMAEVAYLQHLKKAFSIDATVAEHMNSNSYADAVESLRSLWSLEQQCTGNLRDRVREAVEERAENLRSSLQAVVAAGLTAMGWPQCDGTPFTPRLDCYINEWVSSCSLLSSAQALSEGIREKACQPAHVWVVDALLAPVREAGYSWFKHLVYSFSIVHGRLATILMLCKCFRLAGS